jgi:hypothetical protein
MRQNLQIEMLSIDELNKSPVTADELANSTSALRNVLSATPQSAAQARHPWSTDVAFHAHGSAA